MFYIAAEMPFSIRRTPYICAMKKMLFLSLFVSLLIFNACDKDDATPTEPHTHDQADDYDYQIQLMAPSAMDKKVGDTVHVHVEFASGTGETIHHIQVSLMNQADSTVVYSEPNVAHVHQSGGTYSFHDDIVLTEANGVMGHTNWTLEAKVWGHDAGLQEVVERVSFHVHPQ